MVAGYILPVGILYRWYMLPIVTVESYAKDRIMIQGIFKTQNCGEVSVIQIIVLFERNKCFHVSSPYAAKNKMEAKAKD